MRNPRKKMITKVINQPTVIYDLTAAAKSEETHWNLD
jgi:hypothetical protein